MWHSPPLYEKARGITPGFSIRIAELALAVPAAAAVAAPGVTSQPPTAPWLGRLR